MSADFHHPSHQEIQAYIRRGHHARSQYIADMIGKFIAMVRPRRTPSVEKLPTPVAVRDGSRDHRLAA